MNAKLADPGAFALPSSNGFGVVLTVDRERGRALVLFENGRTAEALLGIVEAGQALIQQYEVTPDLLEAQKRLAAAKARYGFTDGG